MLKSFRRIFQRLQSIINKKTNPVRHLCARRYQFFKAYEITAFYSALLKDLSWVKSRVSYFLHNWIYTTNHKRIAINYFIFIIFSGITGLVLATVIRLELAYPGVGILAGDSIQYLTIITLHGIIMVFFMIMPLFLGAFGNFLIPTQLGVHDVAFPRMNSASFWFLPGGLIMLCQLLCVDRRYQRVNCFNVREVQSLLKRKYFSDLIASHEAHELHAKTLAGLRYKLGTQISDIPTFHLLTNHGIVTGHRARRWYFENWVTSTFQIPLTNSNEVLKNATFFNYFTNFQAVWLKFIFAFNQYYEPIIHPLQWIHSCFLIGYKTFCNIICYYYEWLIVPILPRSYRYTTPSRIFFRMHQLTINDTIHWITFLNDWRKSRSAFKLYNKIHKRSIHTIIDFPVVYWSLVFDLNNNIRSLSILLDIHSWLNLTQKIHETFSKIAKTIFMFYDNIMAMHFYPIIAYVNILHFQAQLDYFCNTVWSLYLACNTLVHLVILDFYLARDNWSLNQVFHQTRWLNFYTFANLKKINSVWDMGRFAFFTEIFRTSFWNSKNELGLHLIYRFDLLAIALFKTIVASIKTYQQPSESELFVYWEMLSTSQIDRPYSHFTTISEIHFWMNEWKNIYFFVVPVLLSKSSRVSQQYIKTDDFINRPIIQFKNTATSFQLIWSTNWLIISYPYKQLSETIINIRPILANFWLRVSHFNARFGVHVYTNFRVYTANIFSIESLNLHFFLIKITKFCIFSLNIFSNHFALNKPLDIITLTRRMFWDAQGAQVFDQYLSSIEDISFRFMRRSKPNFKYDDKAGNFLPEVRQHAFQQMISTYSHISRGLLRPIWYLSDDFFERFNEFFSIYFTNFVTHFAKEVAYATQPLIAPEIRYYKLPFWHVNGWDGLLAHSTSLLVDGELNNTRWIALKSLTDKFHKMFLNEIQQYRLLNNWRSLKFHREAWRSRALLSRHQRSTYKRYLHEDALFWVVERNSRDVLPGWAFITPFASRTRFTATGKVDMALMAVFLAGAGSIISSANFLLTYRYLSTLGNKKMRDARSFFTEAAMISSGMIIGANPLLLIAILMLLSDRHWRTSFFDYSGGGDTVLFQHMFWFFGHPEVYIIIMPCFGITNTVLTYYLRKRISARASVLYSMYTIAFLSFFVWGHHMYMVGLSHQTRMLYSTVTVMISVPAATKIIHWMVTLVNSSIHFELPLLFTFTFIFFFISGGVSGMGVAHTGMDILFHDTFYVIAHFHVMFASAAMFSGFSAFYFYFPVLFGIKYSRIFAYMHYVYYLIGQLMTVIPMFWLGYAGMPRRILDYPTAFGGWHSIASAGHLISVAGLMAFFFMLVDSIRQSKAAIRTTFGVGRYNTRLNFYYYEIYRLNYLRTKSLSLLRTNSLPTLTWKGQMYKNYEHLETSLYSYSFSKSKKNKSRNK